MERGNDLFIEYLISIIESRDFSADHHCERVRLYTEVLLEKIMKYCPEYHLTEQQCEKIAFAAMIHDIGKISVPDQILQKPVRLSYDEFQIVKNHTRKGRQIFEHVLKNMSKEEDDYILFQYCAEVCMYHHERFDGSGYPIGLKKDEIPISAQVVGLADAYDALISERIYKPAFDKDEAFEMIVDGECGIFNPRLIEIFLMVRMELEEIQEAVVLRES